VSSNAKQDSSARRRCASRLRQQSAQSPLVDRLLQPERVTEKPGPVRFVRPVQNAPADVDQAFVGQHDQSRQVVLKGPELARFSNRSRNTSACLATIGAGLTIGSPGLPHGRSTRQHQARLGHQLPHLVVHRSEMTGARNVPQAEQLVNEAKGYEEERPQLE